MTGISYRGRYVESTTKTHLLTTTYKSGKQLKTRGNLGECELYQQMRLDNNRAIIVSSVITEATQEPEPVNEII